MRTCFRLDLQQQPVQRAHAHPHSSMLPLNQAEVRTYLFGPVYSTPWRSQVRTRVLTCTAIETETAFLRTQAALERTRRWNISNLPPVRWKHKEEIKMIYVPSRSFESLLPRGDSWWTSVLSRFSCRCPSSQPAPVRRKLGNHCKFYPVSHHLERYWANPLRHEACLMSEASYIPADVSSLPFLYTPTVYLCTNSAVKQTKSAETEAEAWAASPGDSRCSHPDFMCQFNFKHRQLPLVTLSSTRFLQYYRELWIEDHFWEFKS